MHMLLSANISTTTRSYGSHTRCLLQKQTTFVRVLLQLHRRIRVPLL